MFNHKHNQSLTNPTAGGHSIRSHHSAHDSGIHPIPASIKSDFPAHWGLLLLSFEPSCLMESK